MAYKIVELSLFELTAKVAEILSRAKGELSIKTVHLKLSKEYQIFTKLSEVRMVVDKLVKRFASQGFIKLIKRGSEEELIVEVLNKDIFKLLASSPKTVEMFLEKRPYIKNADYFSLY